MVKNLLIFVIIILSFVSCVNNAEIIYINEQVNEQLTKEETITSVVVTGSPIQIIEPEIKCNEAFINQQIQENLEWIRKINDDYGYSVVVKLKETDYDFNIEGKIADEVIKILWERNIVVFYTRYHNLLLYDCSKSPETNMYKILHYFFDNFEELKTFVKETYINNFAYELLYGERACFLGDSEYLFVNEIFFGTYAYSPFSSSVEYEIINVTDDRIDVIAFFGYTAFPDEYVVFEIEYTAVKENGEWRLTEMIGAIDFWMMYEEMQG
ncbi:MAG: hypothetical protein LBC71_02705 [Oscillospiraceae bacterium]|jgi:ribosomal protein S25|nr:hypothetical protein [Oscillospiraceae bacterium]